MLNHSTWRLNDSTFRLNRRRTCQDHGEAGKLEAQLARIAAKLASWRRNLPGSRQSWHVGGETCQDRGEVRTRSKKSQEKCTFSFAKLSLVERGIFQEIPNLNASAARGRFARTVGGGSIRQACFRNYSMKAPGRHGHGATTIFHT